MDHFILELDFKMFQPLTISPLFDGIFAQVCASTSIGWGIQHPAEYSTLTLTDAQYLLFTSS